MKSLIIVAMVCLAAAEVIPHFGPVESHVPLNYKVQISDPPLIRWAPMLKDFNSTLHRFIEFVDLLPIPKGFYDGVEWYAKN